MSLSGVQVDEEVLKTVDLINIKKKYQYITYKIDETVGKIVVDKYGDRGEDAYDRFLNDIQCVDANGSDECRYAIYDFIFEVQNQGCEPSFRDTLVLFKYCPDSAKIKKKMLYSSSVDSLKNAFGSVTPTNYQASDQDALSYVEVKKSVTTYTRT